jgi:hypothetical protein
VKAVEASTVVTRLTYGGEVVRLMRRPPFTPRTIARLEGLDQLKNPVTSGIEPATFCIVAYNIKQLRFDVKITYLKKLEAE